MACVMNSVQLWRVDQIATSEAVVIFEDGFVVASRAHFTVMDRLDIIYRALVEVNCLSFCS